MSQLYLLKSLDGAQKAITGEVTVGRNPNCGLRLPEGGPEGGPSRMHAQLSIGEGALWVEDLKSKNGTFVNEQRVTTKTRLRAGDRLRFDRIEFVVHAVAAGSRPLLPAPHPGPRLPTGPRPVTAVRPLPRGARIPSQHSTAAVRQVSGIATRALQFTGPQAVFPHVLPTRELKTVRRPVRSVRPPGLPLLAPPAVSRPALPRPGSDRSERAVRAVTAPPPPVPRAAQAPPAATAVALAQGDVALQTAPPPAPVPRSVALLPPPAPRNLPMTSSLVALEEEVLPKSTLRESQMPGAWADPKAGPVDAKTALFSSDKVKELNAQAFKSTGNTTGKVDEPTLTCLTGLETGRRFKLATPPRGSEKLEWSLGSDPTQDVVLSGAGVSAQHACIVNDGERWKIIDRLSSNGTFVNNRRTNSSFLSSGDVVRLGTVECVLELPIGYAAFIRRPPEAPTGSLRKTRRRRLQRVDARTLIISFGVTAAILVMAWRFFLS